MQTRIKHINKYEEKVNSFVQGTFSEEKILKKYLQLKSLDKKKLPLATMLLGVKDIINVNGYPTKCGSDLPYELFDGSQASCVSKLLDAGAIFAGKTVTAEFAVSDPGKTKNPRNLNHTPGGSSSGSGASVAASFCDIAIGTQTSGSIIRPAGYCGVIGYKPSFGRINRDGILLFSESMDHVGLITKDMKTLEKSLPIIVNDWLDSEEILKNNFSIGIPEGSYLELANSEVSSQYYEVLKILKQNSLPIKSFQLVEDINIYNDILDKITCAELYKVHKNWFQDYKNLYKPLSRESIEIGKSISNNELKLLLERARADQKNIQSIMINNNIDVWIAPVAPTLAPASLNNTGDYRMNSFWSYTGLPVISIPTGVNDYNLPYAIQIVGQYGKDEKLIKIVKFLKKIIAAKKILNEWELT